MADLVDQIFPPINMTWAPEYTDFNYWKQPIQKYPLPDLLPPSPALSAVSDTSSLSTFDLLRNFSLGRQSGSHFRSRTKVVSVGEVKLRKLSSLDFLRERLLGTPEISQSSSDHKEHRLSSGSIPGSLYDLSVHQYDDLQFDDDEGDKKMAMREGFDQDKNLEMGEQSFDEDLFAAGEMQSVPFL